MWEWLLPVLIIVGVVLVAIGLLLWVSARSLAALRSEVDESWQAVQAVLSERSALVPLLLETLRQSGSADVATAKATLRARDEAVAAVGVAAAGSAEENLTRALQGLFHESDGYPSLQTKDDFLSLKETFVDSGNLLQAARRQYNGRVREYNSRIRAFPAVTFARHEQPRDFFDTSVSGATSEAPRIQF